MTTEHPTPWSKEEITAFLHREELGYQKIELPYGLSTPGQARPELCDIAFGDELHGQSVLDVGSYLGYFCLVACERGASRVVGLEVDPIRVQQARTLADIRGLDPDYCVKDIEYWDTTEQFDVVLCLNVLHHLFDPIHVLHKLVQMTRRTLVLEVAGFGLHDAAKLGVGYLLRQLLQRLPIVYVSSGLPSLHRSAESQKYFFSVDALLSILSEHDKVFSRIEVIPSTFKNRYIIRATRRRIGHLIVVAGPTSSGKSTFMRKLSDGSLPHHIAAQLPASAGGWPQMGAARFISGRYRDQTFDHQDWLEGLVLHYDILRPYRSGTHSYQRDQALDLLMCAEKLTVVNLRPDNAQLCRQLMSGELAEMTQVKKRQSFARSLGDLAVWVTTRLPRSVVSVARGSRAIKRLYRPIAANRPSDYHRQLLTKYKQSGWVANWYARWSGYLDTTVPNAEVIDVGWKTYPNANDREIHVRS